MTASLNRRRLPMTATHAHWHDRTTLAYDVVRPCCHVPTLKYIRIERLDLYTRLAVDKGMFPLKGPFVHHKLM